MSSNPKQRLTLTNLTEPQQLRELNRQLTWIWDQLLGGLSMKSLNQTTQKIIDSKASSEVVGELGNVVESHSTWIGQTDTEIKAMAESVKTVGGKVDKNTAELSVQADRIAGVVERVTVLEGGGAGETVLAEMDNGSVQLYGSEEIARYARGDLGIAAGDKITWSIYVTPDRQKAIGLNVQCLGSGEDLYGDVTLIDAGSEQLLEYELTIPDKTTMIVLYLHDSTAGAGDAATVLYRDSKLVKKVSSGYVEKSVFEQTASEIRAEVEKKLNADDPAKSVDTKAGVVINAEGVRMYGENIEMETSDGESYARLSGTGFSASSIQSPDVTPRYAGPTAIYIDPAAAKEGEIVGADGERRYYYRSLADALSRLSGKAVNEDVTIWMQAGAEEYAHVGLEGVFGAGKITLSGRSGEGSNYRLNGCLNIHQCAVQVTVYRMDIVSPDNAAIEISACQYVSLMECSLTRENTPLLVTNGSKAKVNDTVLNGSSRAAMVNGDAQAFFLNTSGNGQLIVFGGGIMLAAGTTPSGGAGALTNDVFGGGLYVDAGVTNGAGTTAPEVEAVQTAEILASATDSYGTEAGWTIRNQSGVQDNDVRQGWGEGIGRVFGCMWFDVSRFAGRTVKQASLRLCKVRDDLGGTGRGTEVTVHLYGTTKTGAAGSMNENGLHDYGEIGTVVPGAPNVITIPVQAAQDLADGTINGLVLYCPGEGSEYKPGKGFSRNYMRFYGETSGNAENMPMLTVTYE